MNFILKYFNKRKYIKKEHMEHFSHEYLNKLIAEHKLVSITIQHIMQYHVRFTQNHDVNSITSAIISLKSKKVELEGMIDVLNNYLDG